MSDFINKVKLIFEDRGLRNRILFVVFGLVIFRALAHITIPSIDPQRLDQFFANNQFFGFLDIFAGGGLSKLSIIMLGLQPYITASIILQLLTMIFPKLKEMYQEEGDAGKRKFAQYTRMLTVPLAAVQGFAYLTLLSRNNVIEPLTGFGLFLNIAIITGGALLLMWIGELISEYGIGNGSSILIAAGIVAGLPGEVTQLVYGFTPDQIPYYLGFIAAGLLIIYGIVVVTEAERPIPITYAKRVRGMKIYGGISTYLPLRLNQTGVIPIIFALSILLFPQMIFSFLNTWIVNPTLASISNTILKILANGWFYAVAYFILIFVFTYFYTAISFDPEQISENLQKNGAFIPGVRPGRPTAEYIGRITNRITLVGATFLGIVAVMPLAIKAATGITAIAVGGTSILIVISVAIDLLKKVDAQVSMREY